MEGEWSSSWETPAESAFQVVKGEEDEDVFEHPLTRDRRVVQLREQLQETLSDLQKFCKEAKSDEVTSALSENLLRVDEMVRDLCEQVDNIDHESPGGDIEFFTGSSAREIQWRCREEELREELSNECKKQSSRLKLQHKIEMGALICSHKKAIDKYVEHKVKAEAHAKLLREVNKELGLKTKSMKRRAELMQQTMQELREQLALALNANTELEFESLQEVENYQVRVDMMEQDARQSERLRYSEDDVQKLMEDLERSHMREMEEVMEEERARRAEDFIAMQSDLCSEHEKETELKKLEMETQNQLQLIELRQELEQRHSQALLALASELKQEHAEDPDKLRAGNVEAPTELETKSASVQEEEEGGCEYDLQLATLQDELVHVLSLLNDAPPTAEGDAEKTQSVEQHINENAFVDTKSPGADSIVMSPKLQRMLAVRRVCQALQEGVHALLQKRDYAVPLSSFKTLQEEFSTLEQESASLKKQLQAYQEKGSELAGEVAVRGGTVVAQNGAVESLQDPKRCSLKLEQPPSNLQAEKAALQKEREEVFRVGRRLRDLLLECGNLVRGAPSPSPSPSRVRAEGAAPVADEPLSLWALLEELETQLRIQVSGDVTSSQGAAVQLFTISEEPEEASPDAVNPEKPRKKDKLKKALRDKKARAGRTMSDGMERLPPGFNESSTGEQACTPHHVPVGDSVWAPGMEQSVCEVLTTVPLPPGVIAPPGTDPRISVHMWLFRYHDDADDASGAKIATKITLPTPPYRSQQGYEVETKLIRDTTRMRSTAAQQFKSRAESDALGGKVPKQTRESQCNSTEGLPARPSGPQPGRVTETIHPEPKDVKEPGTSLSPEEHQTEEENERNHVKLIIPADGQIGQLQADAKELGSLVAQKDSEIESLLRQLKSSEEEGGNLHGQVAHMSSELHMLHGQIQDMAQQRSLLEAVEIENKALRNKLMQRDSDGLQEQLFPVEHSASETDNQTLDNQLSDKDGRNRLVNSSGKKLETEEEYNGENNVDDTANYEALLKSNTHIEELKEIIKQRDVEIGAMGHQVQELRLQLQERTVLREASTIASYTQTDQPIDHYLDPEAPVSSDDAARGECADSNHAAQEGSAGFPHARSPQAQAADDDSKTATGEDGDGGQGRFPEGDSVLVDVADGARHSATRLSPAEENSGLGSEKKPQQQEPQLPEGVSGAHDHENLGRHGDEDKCLGSTEDERFPVRLLEDEDVKMLLTRIRQTDQELVHINLRLAQGAPLEDDSLLSQLLRQLAGLTEHVCSLTEEKAALRRTVLALERENGNARNTHPAQPDTEASSHASREQSVGEGQPLQALDRRQGHAEEALKDFEHDPFESGHIPTPSVPAGKFAQVYEQFLHSERLRGSLVFQKQYLLLAIGRELRQSNGMGSPPPVLVWLARPPPSETCITPALRRLRSAVRAVMAMHRFQLQGQGRQLYYQLPGAQQEQQGSILSPCVDCDGCCLHGSARQLSRMSSCVSLDNGGRHGRRCHGHGCACALCTGDHSDPDKALLDYISKLDDIQLRLGQHYAEPLLVQYRSKRI